MAKTPKLSKELKNSGKKARKRFIKAYEKSLKKQGSKKKAYRKAYEKLSSDFELRGKKWVAKTKDAAPTESAKLKSVKPKSVKSKTKKQGKKKKELVDLEANLPDTPIFDLEDVVEEDIPAENLCSSAEAEIAFQKVAELDAESPQTYVVEELPEILDQQADTLVDEALETSIEDTPQNYTRAQLYRLAQELKIAGRSSMNKEQLFIAVKEAQQLP